MNRLQFLGTTILGLFNPAQKIEPQHPKMKRINDTLYDIIDTYTGENFNYTKVTTFADGSAMTDAKCEGVIYRKLGNEYFKRNFTGAVNVRWFGAKGDGITDDTPAFIIANRYPLKISNGVFFINSDFEFLNTISSENAIIKSNSNIIINGLKSDFNQCFDISGSLLIRNVEKINARWFGSNGNGKACGGSITSGTKLINTTGYNTFSIGDKINIKGAGLAGALLTSTVVSVTINTITIADNCLTTVSVVPVCNFDDSTYLNRFFQCLSKTIDASSPNTNGVFGSCTGYLPRGIYVALQPLKIYAGCLINGEYSNVLGGTVLLQGDISKPLIHIVADNFNDNNLSVGGNGNNIVKNISFKSAFIDDNFKNEPIIKFLPAYNIHSDTEFDHCLFQNVAGYCFSGGFKTTGSGTSGSNLLTLIDGSVFRSNGDDIGGSRIIIKGAGAGGVDLSTYIISGGGTNNVVLATNILTTVTAVNVLPTKETINPLKINNCEFDIVRGGFEFINNCDGMLIINHQETFQSVRGFVFIDSLKPWILKINDSLLEGCGNAYNSEPNYTNSIFVRNKGINGGEVHIDNVDIRKLDIFTGRMSFENIEILRITNNYLKDLDHGGLAKFIASLNIKISNITNNIFHSKELIDYTNSRLIAISNTDSYITGVIKENHFINENVNAFSNFIQSDYALPNYSVKNNFYKGNVTSVATSEITDSIIRSEYEDSSVTKKANAVPTQNAWKKGDRVINSNPIVGNPKAWVCTVDGSPGTWVSEGNL